MPILRRCVRWRSPDERFSMGTWFGAGCLASPFHQSKTSVGLGEIFRHWQIFSLWLRLVDILFVRFLLVFLTKKYPPIRLGRCAAPLADILEVVFRPAPSGPVRPLWIGAAHTDCEAEGRRRPHSGLAATCATTPAVHGGRMPLLLLPFFMRRAEMRAHGGARWRWR